MIKRLLALVILVAPFAVWGMFKPIRVIAPQLNGVTCLNETVCLEDPSQQEEAMYIYELSSSTIVEKLGKLKNDPRAIFCSTEACFRSFGLYAPSKAAAVGVSGLVISPRGWEKSMVSHEFIHHMQAEKFGVMQMLTKPEWLLEGMAYYFAENDMTNVPQRYVDARNQFEAWYLKNDEKVVWDQLKSIKK